MRVTMLVRSTTGLEASMRARTARQRQRVKAATARSLDRVFTRAQESTPRDTHYMALHMRAELIREGYDFAVGFRSSDFVGQTNPATGQVITAFYPVFVIKGTRFMAGRDFLSAALRAERMNIRRGYARALSERSA